jgi:hypothetical protein
MNQALRLFLAAAAAIGIAGCTSNYYTPNVIRLDPSGSSSDPATQSIASSFTLIATEDGYTGQFTADTIVGTCWVVQSPVTTSGAWTVVPQGVTCPKHEVDEIQVKDTNGHSAETYIRSVGNSDGAIRK